MTTPTTPDGPAAMPALPAVITVKQTSQVLGLRLRTTYRLVEAGVIPVIRVGRRIRVITHKLYATFGIPLDQPIGEPTDGDHGPRRRRHPVGSHQSITRERWARRGGL